MEDVGSLSTVARARNARIAAIVACVPKNVVRNADFTDRFGDSVQQIVKMTGVVERHIVEENVTTSDLCAAAAVALFDRASVNRQDIDAILFFSQTPDYRLPATACELQARLGLRTGIVAFDVNLGCSAYPYALWLGSMMIESGAAKKVLLMVGDTISRIVDDTDRATALIFGDCGTATLLEASMGLEATFILGSDGAGAPNLIVPAGCFRVTDNIDDRNPNRQDTLFMDGGEIFNFTLKAVPKLIQALFAATGKDSEDYDHFLFHQANAFMVNHLRKKAKLPAEKVPINIDRFGNTSSGTIPLLIVTECRDAVTGINPCELAMFGFGVGYSWAAAAMNVSNLACADLVEL